MWTQYKIASNAQQHIGAMPTNMTTPNQVSPDWANVIPSSIGVSLNHSKMSKSPTPSPQFPHILPNIQRHFQRYHNNCFYSSNLCLHTFLPLPYFGSMMTLQYFKLASKTLKNLPKEWCNSLFAGSCNGLVFVAIKPRITASVSWCLLKLSLLCLCQKHLQLDA